MKKNEFISSLRSELKHMQKDELEELIEDYEEHFRVGKQKGKKETEIAKALGNPKEIAKHIKTDYYIKKAESKSSPKNIAKAVLAATGLGFFNLIVVLGPFLGIVAVLLALLIVGIAIVAVGFVLALICILGPNIPYVNIGVNIFAGIFFAIGIICLGILFIAGVYYLSKWFFIGTVKYLKWNLEIIKRE